MRTHVRADQQQKSFWAFLFISFLYAQGKQLLRWLFWDGTWVNAGHKTRLYHITFMPMHIKGMIMAQAQSLWALIFVCIMYIYDASSSSKKNIA